MLYVLFCPWYYISLSYGNSFCRTQEPGQDYLIEKKTENGIPGTVFTDLLQAGRMEDPFYRDNEEQSLKLSYRDYEYICDFRIDKELLEYDQIILCCKGLDTLTEIKINNRIVARANNMHRIYEFNIKEVFREGINTIHIVFFSPTRYIEQKQQEMPL